MIASLYQSGSFGNMTARARRPFRGDAEENRRDSNLGLSSVAGLVCLGEAMTIHVNGIIHGRVECPRALYPYTEGTCAGFAPLQAGVDATEVVGGLTWSRSSHSCRLGRTTCSL